MPNSSRAGKQAGRDFPDQRAFPRIQFPSHRRPYLVTRGGACEVIDCAERGVRYADGGDTPALGGELWARLCFRTGQEVEIGGVVVRARNGEVALWLHESHAIPGDLIAREERALREG